MNTLFSKITLAVAITIGTVACRNENLISPDKPEGGSTHQANDIIPVNLPKYTLVKDGPQTVTYYPDGRLKRVIYGDDIPTNSNERVDYTYDNQSVTAKTVYNSKVYSEKTYGLDANGRCFQYREYTFPDGGLTKVKYLYNSSYTYDAQGRLKTWTSITTSLTLQYEYTYNADGDLSKVVRYNADVADEEFTFIYKLLEAPELLPDAYPLSAQLNFKWWGPLADTYLPVFGNSSPHLLKRLIRKNLTTNQVDQDTKFTYTLNPNGYVSNQTCVNTLTGVVRNTKAYEYVAVGTLPTF